MYNASEDYKNAILKNVRTPKNKVVVGGVEYTGRLDLLTFPKITQETTMMIGGFPAKTVEFELYDKDGNINLLNKDVVVYRGYDIGKLTSAGDITKTTNLMASGMDFSKGFSIKLRGFFDVSKLAANTKILDSTNNCSMVVELNAPQVLKVNIGTTTVNVNISAFTKSELLTINWEYNMQKMLLTVTNGKTTVTNNVAYTGTPSFGTYFFIGSKDNSTVSIFDYDSVEINTPADNKAYKFIADEMDKWKSLGDRATYTINGKWAISDNTEYIPMGIYRARAEEDITNNSTNKKIIFKGTDRAVEFNNIHDTSKDPAFPCTYLDYLKSIVESYGYELENEDFPFATTTMARPPHIATSITDRELISRFAEMCGGIAQMSRAGKVAISTPLKTNTQIPKTYYGTLSSKEKKYGCISNVILGRASEDNTIFEDIDKVDTEIQNQAYGRNQLTLNKLAPGSSTARINSIESNKIILTSSTNAGAWEGVRFDLTPLKLTEGIYTLYSKILATNNTSSLKSYIYIDKHASIGGASVKRWAYDGNTSVQFEVESGYYYSIVFYTSTDKAIVGTNTVTCDQLYIAKESEFSKYEPYEANGVYVWRIDNNPFLDLIREEMIDRVAANIFGQSVVPFQLDECIDDFIYDLNDVIEVQDKMGSWFETKILNISSSGRIRTTYGAYTQEEETSYNLTGSASDTSRNVQVNVDRINGQITAINEVVGGLGTQYTQTEQNFQFLFNENSVLKDYINFEDGAIILGKVGNEFKMVQRNDSIQILQNQQATAQFLHNLFESEDMRAKKSVQVGNFILEQDEDGSLDLELGGEQ